MKYFLGIILLYHCMVSCKKNKDVAPEINLTEINSRFPTNTQFKSISVLPKVQTVVINDLQSVQKFEEYQYRHQKWKKIGEYNSELQGNVNQVDFLFGLNDSLQAFVNHKKDSISKENLVHGLLIATENSFVENNKIVIIFLIKDGKENKKLIFNY